jgi:malate dehydrogenase
MDQETAAQCTLPDSVKERDRIGVWGFGNVSRDVVHSLADERLGKEIVFYARPKQDYPNRARAWIDDFKANAFHAPRMRGTNKVEDMAGLDVIFIGVGVPRKPGQSRRDLLQENVGIIADASRQIRKLYEGCSRDDLPVLIFMGNPVTAMTWVGYKVSGFPRQNVMGQAGNLDARRICFAAAREMGISGAGMQGIVFGEHGDSMVASPRFFSVGGVSLDVLARSLGIDPSRVEAIMQEAKKGGTHFVHETGQSASTGPSKAVCDMLRCVISGQSELQPVIAVLEREYGLLGQEDGLDSMSFGVPAQIGSLGVERIVELPVEEIREQLRNSASIVKDDIRAAAEILREKRYIA